jgi:hypothetical protein
VVSQIPEVKEMVACARRFLDDSTNIHELHSHAQQCKTAAKLLANNTAIVELASEWVTMSNRYWNEWGTEDSPLTKEEFKIWLREQVNYF